MTIAESIYQFDSRPYAAGVDVNAIRLANLKALQGEIPREELAERLGIAYEQVGHWFMDPEKDGHRNIGAKTARRIEDRFKKPHGWLDQPHAMLEEPTAHYAPLRRVPVIGHVIANPTEDGYFDDMGFPPGAGEEYVAYPTRDSGAYAVRVRGDSYRPRYRPGTVLVITPAAAVAPGDDVIVRTRGGRKMIKQLLYQRGDEITLGSINDRYGPITLPLDEVDSMHYVAGPPPADPNTRTP